MIDSYITIKNNGTYETEVKKSRFITTLVRIENEEQAKEIISQTKKTHWKANHNCSAFVLGNNQEIQRSSDDGEPSGTAGIPMLEVLKKLEIINTLVIVTRYFGGTKLGAGGLIRAYSSAVSEAIKHIGLVKGTLQQELIVTLDYPQHSTLEYFISQQQLTLKDTTYTDNVTLTLIVPTEKSEEIANKITNLLNGSVTLSYGDKSYFEDDFLI